MSGLVTTTLLNTKISEVEKKIPNTINLVTANALNTKISEVGMKFLVILNILLIKNLIS